MCDFNIANKATIRYRLKLLSTERFTGLSTNNVDKRKSHVHVCTVM